jgi:poly-gamma-glutamate synthesis protein (capsule biosynthesis protein)
MAAPTRERIEKMSIGNSNSQPGVRLFLSGDIMTGRGIDQILPHPGDPRLYEPYIRSAIGYIDLAEQTTGRFHHPVDFDYVWGDALAEFDRLLPPVRIVNLETAVTVCNDAWPGKNIHYRMHPANTPCLQTAHIDCCVLANNHVLDWGYAGLRETLDTLHAAGIYTAGAGANSSEATAPAVLTLPSGVRVLVFAFGAESAGVRADWAATDARAGVSILDDLSMATIKRIADQVHAVKRAGDIAIASLHWGSNWGYDIDVQQRVFAHGLIDHAGIDILHGHSSHHPRGIEVHHGKLILYGCGDLLNDYEGISGYQSLRSDLACMYFPTIDPADGCLLHLKLIPMQIRHLRVNRACDEDASWLAQRLSETGTELGTRVRVQARRELVLELSG